MCHYQWRQLTEFLGEGRRNVPVSPAPSGKIPSVNRHFDRAGAGHNGARQRSAVDRNDVRLVRAGPGTDQPARPGAHRRDQIGCRADLRTGRRVHHEPDVNGIAQHVERVGHVGQQRADVPVSARRGLTKHLGRDKLQIAQRVSNGSFEQGHPTDQCGGGTVGHDDGQRQARAGRTEGKPNFSNRLVSKKAATWRTPAGVTSSTCRWNARYTPPSPRM